MSVLFPKLNKPRQWDYRPIYYDPEKEERKEKLAKLQAEREKQEKEGQKPTYQTSLHRGSFREARGEGHKRMDEARSKSRLWFWIALLGMLALFIYIISTRYTL